MPDILATTIPFFALVLCGYVAVRARILPQSAIPGMNGFVLYFALPCLLFQFGAGTPVAQLFDAGLFGVYLLCALLMVALAVGLARRDGRDWNNSAFGALAAAFPNTGFMGVPLLVALLGPLAAGPIIVTIATDLIITTSVCVALSRLGQMGQMGQMAHMAHMAHMAPAAAARPGAPASNGSMAALRLALVGMLRNPMPWAIALGALASGAGLALSGPLERTVALLADAASPVALFTIGAMLARARLAPGAALDSDGGSGPGFFAPAAGSRAASGALALACAKLLLHPALVAGVAYAALAAGLAIDRFALTVLVLVACLPSAGNVAMLAERFGADSGRVARIILFSTALSFFTFPAAVALCT